MCFFYLSNSGNGEETRRKALRVKRNINPIRNWGITLPTVTQAMKNEITIIARKDIKLIARKLGHSMS